MLLGQYDSYYSCDSYGMTHNIKRRVGQTHWRDRKQIDISLQLECCAISKIKNFKNNNQHNPDLYNVFHLFFVSTVLDIIQYTKYV